MTRFNSNSSISTKTVNKAGGEAFIQSDKAELAAILLTSFLKNEFYSSADQTVKRLKDLISKEKDKAFIAKAALYARTKYGMRSVSHLAASELAHQVKGASWSKSFFDKIVYRPDDMTEIMACYGHDYGKPFPNCLKKGFRKALGRFDAYKLAKYRGEGKDISLVDIVNLVHPKSTEAITALMKGELKNTDTWEAKLSAAGQSDDEDTEELKSKAWTELLKEKKLGYFALLRNLRNIIQQAPEAVDLACEALVNEEAIKKSLVLPFRFLSAIKSVQEINEDGTRKVLMALNRAVDIALSNVPKMPGKTLVVLDTSGSMSGRPIEIGSLFAATLVKANDADFMQFSSDAKYITLNPMDSTLTLAQMILNNCHGGGTNFHAIFETANKKYDRVILLSDMQAWMSHEVPTKTFQGYKARLGANPHVYSFDLAGLGSLQFPEPQVYCLAGFSDKVFDVMKLLEEDKKALIHEIENMTL